jgi:hypothetical protein
MTDNSLDFTLGEIKGTLTEILRRLDRRDKEVDDDIAEAKKMATAAHVRVSTVERRIAYYVGIGTAVVWVLSHITDWWPVLRTAGL